MDDPGPPKGWPDLPKWCMSFYAWVKQTRALAGIGLTSSETPNGTMFHASPGGGSSGAVYNDFSCSDGSNPTDGTQIQILNGTVGGMLPTGMTEGGSPPYLLSVGGTGFVWLDVTFNDDGSISSVTIDSGDTVPTNTTSEGYCKLCDFDASSGKSVNIGSGIQGIGSQNTIYCGTVIYFYSTTA